MHVPEMSVVAAMIGGEEVDPKAKAELGEEWNPATCVVVRGAVEV